MNTRMKRVSAGLAICLGAVGFSGVAAASAAEANEVVNYTWSRADVKEKADILNAAGLACSALREPYSTACSLDANRGSAFVDAAANNCGLQQRTILTGSIYSWDKSRTTLTPINCA